MARFTLLCTLSYYSLYYHFGTYPGILTLSSSSNCLSHVLITSSEFFCHHLSWCFVAKQRLL